MYADLDIECFRPFAPLLPDASVLLSYKQGSNFSRGASNSIFGSAAHHPFWDAVFQVLANRANVVDDAVLAEPKTQSNLRRLEADDAPVVDKALREACRRLLDVPDEGIDVEWAESPAEAALVAQACKYIASRVCAPRDMGAKAAAALRTVLLQLAAEAELYAWKFSGGLL